MAVEAEFEGKKLTNHSARKTLAKKLKAVNSHTNERSVADYEGDENEQQLISSIISAEALTGQIHRYQLERIGVNSAVSNTVMNEERMMTVNHFHGCQVTINCQFRKSKVASAENNAQSGHVQDE